MKVLAASLAVAGVMIAAQPAAQAAVHVDGVTKNQAVTDDMSARRYRRAVVRRYEAPRYYGYYGPTYYERPYARPSPVWFGLGGWW
jgi:hypothetical protein